MKPLFVVFLIVSFVVSSLYIPQAYAIELNLPPMPKPGVMVNLSPEFTPAQLKGIIIHPENALKFDFIMLKGDKLLSGRDKQVEYKKLIKYFLASLAVPDDNQWVNLSPYEKQRIIKNDFGKTEMGRDLLAQDYLLKQITASLIYPEEKLGAHFWDRVYERAYKQFGSTNVPINTFNKVWIVPDDALIYEKGNMAYVIKNHLKVMLEEDYLSLEKHTAILKNTVILSEAKDPNKINSIRDSSGPTAHQNDVNKLGSQVIREIILPELEREVNEGKNFAPLRQVFSGMVLAAWYKRALKESLLGKIYMNKDKVKGVDQDPKNNVLIYQRYLRAFKKGVYNYIKEDVDKYSNETIPRKYFSGGVTATDYNTGKRVLRTETALPEDQRRNEATVVPQEEIVDTAMAETARTTVPPVAINAAMTTGGPISQIYVKTEFARALKMIFVLQYGAILTKYYDTMVRPNLKIEVNLGNEAVAVVTVTDTLNDNLVNKLFNLLSTDHGARLRVIFRFHVVPPESVQLKGNVLEFRIERSQGPASAAMTAQEMVEQNLAALTDVKNGTRISDKLIGDDNREINLDYQGKNYKAEIYLDRGINQTRIMIFSSGFFYDRYVSKNLIDRGWKDLIDQFIGLEEKISYLQSGPNLTKLSDGRSRLRLSSNTSAIIGDLNGTYEKNDFSLLKKNIFEGEIDRSNNSGPFLKIWQSGRDNIHNSWGRIMGLIAFVGHYDQSRRETTADGLPVIESWGIKLADTHPDTVNKLKNDLLQWLDAFDIANNKVQTTKAAAADRDTAMTARQIIGHTAIGLTKLIGGSSLLLSTLNSAHKIAMLTHNIPEETSRMYWYSLAFSFLSVALGSNRLLQVWNRAYGQSQTVSDDKAMTGDVVEITPDNRSKLLGHPYAPAFMREQNGYIIKLIPHSNRTATFTVNGQVKNSLQIGPLYEMTIGDDIGIARKVILDSRFQSVIGEILDLKSSLYPADQLQLQDRILQMVKNILSEKQSGQQSFAPRNEAMMIRDPGRNLRGIEEVTLGAEIKTYTILSKENLRSIVIQTSPRYIKPGFPKIEAQRFYKKRNGNYYWKKDPRIPLKTNKEYPFHNFSIQVQNNGDLVISSEENKTVHVIKEKNLAMVSVPGGIDMNSANLNLQIKRDGNGVPLPVSQQDLENIHIDGLVPVILEIRPAAASPILSQITAIN